MYTRRDFLTSLASAGAAWGLTSLFPPLSRAARPETRDHILIGLPNPFTGPLADFGEATPWANQRAVDAVNAQGGIYLRDMDRKLPVRIKIVDTESDPARAAEMAAKLILHDHVDLMVVMHTPDTVNPVSAVCERYQMPCISLDAPVESWLTGGPYRWCYHAFWTVDALTDLYINLWDTYAAQTNRVVGGFWPNDADGKSWSDLFKKKLPPKGYRVIDPGRFPHLTRDYSAFVDLFKREGVDIVTAVVVPPDWAVAWRQSRQADFVPKIATIGKAILFPSAVTALGGNLPEGLTCEVWWSPHHPFKSSITGETASELCSAWTAETGKQWTQPIGFKYAGFEIALDALKRAASLDRDRLRQAIEETHLNTIVGPIAYNAQHYAVTPLVGGQWVKGRQWPWELAIVSNQGQPSIPTTAKMIFPIPR